MNQSTIVRQLTRAREALVRSARDALKARLRLDDNQMESLARLVRSRIGDSFLVLK